MTAAEEVLHWHVALIVERDTRCFFVSRCVVAGVCRSSFRSIISITWCKTTHTICTCNVDETTDIEDISIWINEIIFIVGYFISWMESRSGWSHSRVDRGWMELNGVGLSHFCPGSKECRANAWTPGIVCLFLETICDYAMFCGSFVIVRNADQAACRLQLVAQFLRVFVSS